MNKITIFLLIVTVFLSVSLFATVQGMAQSRGFSGVMPFMSSSERFGFFEQSTGKIYMYDSNLSDCVFVGQLKELGKSIEKMN